MAKGFYVTCFRGIPFKTALLELSYSEIGHRLMFPDYYDLISPVMLVKELCTCNVILHVTDGVTSSRVCRASDIK